MNPDDAHPNVSDPLRAAALEVVFEASRDAGSVPLGLQAKIDVLAKALERSQGAT